MTQNVHKFNETSKIISITVRNLLENMIFHHKNVFAHKLEQGTNGNSKLSPF